MKRESYGEPLLAVLAPTLLAAAARDLEASVERNRRRASLLSAPCGHGLFESCPVCMGEEDAPYT